MSLGKLPDHELRVRCSRLRINLLIMLVVMMMPLPLLAGGPAANDPSSLSVHQLQHNVWRASDGAPQWAGEITQDNKGLLWFSSGAGLYRFDGVHFDRTLSKALNPPQLKTVHASPNGDLWLGFLLGGVGRVHEGKLITYPSGPNVPTGSTFAFFDLPDGTVWLVATNGLSHFVDGAWRAAGLVQGYDGRALSDMTSTPDGALWVYGPANYLVLRPHADRFVEVQRDEAIRILNASRNDSYFVLNPEYVRYTRDSKGVLWSATSNGLRRTRSVSDGHGGSTVLAESFTSADGLSDNAISEIFEDREGSIWVATALGIDQFRQGKATPVVFNETVLKPAIAVDQHDIAWIGSVWGAWHTAAETSASPIRAPALGTYISCIDVDRWGAVWSAGAKGLLRTLDGHTEAISLPKTLAVNAYRYQAIAVDPRGSPWLSVSGQGLFARLHGQWIKNGGIKGLVDDLATRIHFDEKGRQWITYSSGQLARVTNGAVRVFDARDGLNVGSPTSLLVQGDTIWIGGDQGVARWTGTRFVSLKTTQDGLFDGTTGLVLRSNGDLWAHSNEGLVHIASGELAEAVLNPTYRVSASVIGAHEGVSSAPDKLRPVPSLVAAPDGRLWFTSATGVSWLDPDQLTRNPIRPMPVINDVVVDGQMHPGSGILQLSRGVHNVQIFFTAGSLAVPQRIRFEHRMDGIDKNWQTGYEKRDADYPNLGHGTYRFHLRVTNEDGVPSAAEATVQIFIPPRFYATWWFITLAILFVGLLVWLAYVRQVHRLVTLMRATALERERIARELHDTLLQSTQGLLLLIQAMARDMSEGPIRKRLLRAAAVARETVVEGRAQVESLRSNDVDIDLPVKLIEVAAQLGALYPTEFVAVVEGHQLTLRREMARELFPVLREMLNNAFQHARAGEIRLCLNYALTRFEASVTDDGIGMAQPVLEAGESGHWGLQGMRERVAQLHGTLHVESKESAGTCVRVCIPGGRLYRQSLLIRLIRTRHRFSSSKHKRSR